MDNSEANFLMQMASAAILSERYPQAVNLLKRAIEIEPNEPNTYRDLSIVFILAGQAEEGEQFFSAELAKHIWPCLLLARAQCRLTLKKFDEALVDLNEFLLAKPDQDVIDALYSRFFIRLQQNDRAAALKDARAILSLAARSKSDQYIQESVRETIEKLQSPPTRVILHIPLSMN